MIPVSEKKPQDAPQLPDSKDELFSTAHLKSDLRGRSVRGGAITLTVQGCKFFLQLASTMVLARLLIPADYGLVAMVSAVTGFLAMFSTLGLSTATIQKANITHAQISTLFWVNAGLGLLVALVVMALAPAIAWFYDDRRLLPVTVALGTGFIFGGLSVQHQAMLTRQMRFMAIGVVGTVSMALGLGAAIAAALWGAGYWSLVVMNLTTAFVGAVGRWIAFPWIPGRPKRGVGVMSMLGFGGSITGFQMVNYFSRNADNILIGKYWGAAELGMYSKAYALLMMPLSQLREPLMSVALPSLSRLQSEPARYRNYYLRMLQVLSFLSVPLVAFMGAFSHEIILLILGPGWEEAAAIFTILAFISVLQPATATVGTVMITLGLTQRYFVLGVVTSGLCVISFVIGLPWGARGVALSYTILGYLSTIPYLFYALRGTPVRLLDFLKVFALPFPAALLMIAGGKLAFLDCEGLPQPVALMIAGCVGGLFYLAAYLVLPGGAEVLKNLRSNITLVFKSSRKKTPA